MQHENGKDCAAAGSGAEELARKLEDGASSGKILPWLNGLPEVQAVLRE